MIGILSQRSLVRRHGSGGLRLLAAAVLIVAGPALRARAFGGDNEYQFQLAPSHKITDRLTSMSYLGFNRSEDEGFSTYYLGFPGVGYKVNPWFQLRAVWYTRFTDESEAPDSLELRPSLGFKASVPHEGPVHYYNYTRYEYRAIQDRAADTWDDFNRIRSRFGVEVPLAPRARAWRPGTWYATADIEPFYQYEKGLVSPLNARAGIARILSEQVRIELCYTAQHTRSDTDSPFEETGNILQLNVKVGLPKGIRGHEQSEAPDT